MDAELRPAVPEGVSDVSVTAEPTAGPQAPPAGQARHARRLPPPRRWPGLVRAALARWAARPAGRLIVPGLLIGVFIGATGTAGAYLIPETAPPSPAKAAQGPTEPTPTGEPTTVAPEPPLEPTVEPTIAPPGGREAAKFAAWAAPLAARLQIPQTALEAYGYAQWVLEQRQRDCGLTWTTLAAIGKVESDHGRTKGSSLAPDGRAYPPIIGEPLNGQGGRRTIQDSDGGVLDNDVTYDRAIGPMQFIPASWQSWADDADSNGIEDPQDVDDAALAAAAYLCASGRKLTVAKDWWDAVLAYNHVQQYANTVFETANRYGQQSRNTP